MEERLQKIIAQAGIASRRAAEQLILQGRVRIDGVIVRELGVKIDPAQHQISCDGVVLRSEHKITLLLNKPAGYVTTLSDPQGRPTVSALVGDRSERLFPVGRLDIDTKGALIMTNDGDLAHSILHPRFEIQKTYHAWVRGLPDARSLAQLAGGIVLEDGVKTHPASLRIVARHSGRTLIEVIIHEGKKRQVRKMFAAVDHRVLELTRTAYGGLTLGSLPLGKHRILHPADIKKIFSYKKDFTSTGILD